MATYTTNLNLKKPAQSDKIRIADINNNMDDIDAAFGAIGNDSVATQIGDIQGAVAIVAVGDSHAAVTAGEFVYVKSHETLDVGLYKATANIAQNAALSSSNLTAEPSGGLNALNSKITTKSGGTVSPITYLRSGNVVTVNIHGAVTIGENNVIGTLPEDYRPSVDTYFEVRPGSAIADTYLVSVDKTTGAIKLYNRGNTVNYAYGTCTYVV